MLNYLLRNYFQLGLSMIMLSRAHFNAAGQPAASSLPLSVTPIGGACFPPSSSNQSGALPLSSARPLFRHFKTLSILPQSATGKFEQGCVRIPSPTFRIDPFENALPSPRSSHSFLLPSFLPRLAGPAAFAASLTLTLSEAAAAAVGRFVSSFLKWAARLGDFIFLSNSL